MTTDNFQAWNASYGKPFPPDLAKTDKVAYVTAGRPDLIHHPIQAGYIRWASMGRRINSTGDVILYKKV